MQHKENAASVTFLSEQAELQCSGQWTIESIAAVERKLSELWSKLPKQLTIKRQDIVQMDSAGALLFVNLEKKLQKLGIKVSFDELRPECASIFDLVKSYEEKEDGLFKQYLPNWLAQVGIWGVKKVDECLSFIHFLGHFVSIFIASLRYPKQINWRSILVIIDDTGYQAMPIVALLIFLVGVVMTYQIAIQLSTYGANIYVVDLTGMIVFREFGPLITAIIAAGRTSTSFTAQIGTMKVNEELDALETMGISPFIRIVLPKIVGLMIALPLLTVWADIFGVLGAMLMSKLELGVSYLTYLNRFEHNIPVKHFIIGLVKVPFFAALIALVGSYQGLQVGGSADSVGRKTTKSAVQSIFLIIIADALFSIIFSVRGL